MSKVIVTGIKKNAKGESLCADVQQFKVDMTPLEVKNLLENHEQNIANIKMDRFKRKGGSV